MKIYYTLPDTDDEEQNKCLLLMAENFKLKMMWNLRSLEGRIINENGCIFIDRIKNEEGEETGLNVRFEGFSEELVIVMRGLLSKIVHAKY